MRKYFDKPVNANGMKNLLAKKHEQAVFAHKLAVEDYADTGATIAADFLVTTLQSFRNHYMERSRLILQHMDREEARIQEYERAVAAGEIVEDLPDESFKLDLNNFAAQAA